MLPKRTTADKRSPPRMTNERVPPHNCGSSRTSQIKRGLLARSLVRRCCRLFAHRNVSEMHVCESSRAAIGRSDNNKTDERGSSRCGDPSVSLHSHLNFDLRSNGRLRNHLDHENKLKVHIPVLKVTLYHVCGCAEGLELRYVCVLPSSSDRALAKTGGGIR